MSSHVQQESIWVLNLHCSQRSVGRLKKLCGGFLCKLLRMQIFTNLYMFVSQRWTMGKHPWFLSVCALAAEKHKVPDCYTSAVASSASCPAKVTTTWGQHPPTGPLQKLHLGASKELGVWRSMRSFTLAACAAALTCLGAAVHTCSPQQSQSTLPAVEWDVLSILLKWWFLKGRQ